MSPIDQSAGQSFEMRLSDFGPELGAFLRVAWSSRAKLDLFVRRIKQIGVGKRSRVREVAGVKDFNE